MMTTVHLSLYQFILKELDLTFWLHGKVRLGTNHASNTNMQCRQMQNMYWIIGRIHKTRDCLPTIIARQVENILFFDQIELYLKNTSTIPKTCVSLTHKNPTGVTQIVFDFDKLERLLYSNCVMHLDHMIQKEGA